MATSFDTTLAKLGIGRSTSSATAATASGTSSLNQGDFLKLMTAQLKNQDPFAPVDNTQMVAQMAQFSSLAGISEMNTTLKSISDKLAGTSASDALAYVGRNVLTAGDTAYGRTSGGLAGAVELGGEVSTLSVSILSADGQLIKTLPLGPHSAGTVEFDWDGKTDAGADAGAGPFTVRASAGNAGTTVPANTLVWAPVGAVSIPASGAAVLTLPGIGQVPVTAVRKVG